MKLDTSPQVEGVDYTFSALGGVDGADLATFAAAPTTGEYLTLAFTGLFKARLTYADDKLTVDEFYDRLVKHGVKFNGHLNQ